MNRKVKYTLVTLVVVAICAYIVHQVQTNPEWQNFDFSQFRATLTRLDYRFLLVALGMIYSTYLLRSLRWREFLLPIKSTSLSNVLTATIIGFGGLALLGRPGELLRPYLISRKEEMPMSTQMAVWVLERIYDLCMVILIVGGVMHFSLRGDELHGAHAQVVARLRTAGLTIFLLALSGIAGLILFRRYWETWVPRLRSMFNFLPARLLARLMAMLEDFGQGLSSLRSKRAFLMGVMYTVLVWVSISIGYFLTLKAFGPPLSDFSFAAAILVMGFAIGGSMLQVPGIGGGTQLFTILALTAFFDVRPEIAASAAIVLWLLTFVAVVPLAFLFLLREGLSWRKLGVLTSPKPAIEI